MTLDSLADSKVSLISDKSKVESDGSLSDCNAVNSHWNGLKAPKSWVSVSNRIQRKSINKSFSSIWRKVLHILLPLLISSKSSLRLTVRHGVFADDLIQVFIVWYLSLQFPKESLRERGGSKTVPSPRMPKLSSIGLTWVLFTSLVSLDSNSVKKRAKKRRFGKWSVDGKGEGRGETVGDKRWVGYSLNWMERAKLRWHGRRTDAFLGGDL